MGLVLIERACERFQKQLSTEDKGAIQSSKNVDDVRHAIRRIEQHLVARQNLRNLDRLTPFLDAIDRLSKPIDVLCNGTPFMPYVWAPLKLILLTAQHHTHAIDKLIAAYGSIGLTLPRLSRYDEAFLDDYQFQQLLAYLYTDIIEFHSRAFKLIQKPGWNIFFTSGWGRFENRFDALLQSIAQNSELLDKEATSINIFQAQEWRKKSLEEAKNRERMWESEQREVVLRWLEVGDSKSYQEDKLELLRNPNHCSEGTGQWLTKSHQIRSWLQFGRGHSVLWLHGKPGSGKSVLCSQLIYFLRSDPTRNCLFFFCDFHTKSYAVTAQVLRSLCAQMIGLAPELVPFIYDECVLAGRTPSVKYLKTIVPKLMTAFTDVRVIVDGIDEIDYSQHKELIKTLTSFAESQENFKIIFSSQNIPSIFSYLKSKPELALGAEAASVAADIDLFVTASLEKLNDSHSGGIPERVFAGIRKLILERAEGMFLWVYLVLEILGKAVSIKELQASVDSMPKDLAEAYNKILTNITKSSSANNLSTQRRAFSWMLFSKGNQPLRKHELRLAMTLHVESCVVSKDTKPFPNALDICKPFIEDGPRGSVVFIHSTVPKFLRHPSSGPFIDEVDAHHDLVMGCLGQLLQSLCFVTEQSNPTQMRYHIGQGFHGLLPYSIQNWTEHLLDYLATSAESTSLPSSPVINKLLELCREHDRLSEELEVQESRDISSFRLNQEDNRLNYLKEHPLAFDLVNCVMHFKQVLGSPDGANSVIPGHDTTTSTDLDPTLFPLIRQQYHDGVVHLMSQKSFPGLSQEDLMVFKEEFGPTAFVCHLRGCERSLVGFPSATALKDHEARHRGLLRCPEPGCSYNDNVGFTTLSQVKKHKRKVHPEPLNGEIPHKIRRQTGSQERAPKDPKLGLNSDKKADAYSPAAMPNVGATETPIPGHIIDQVNEMSFQAPAQLAERSGASASRWVEELKQRYGRALMTMESAKQRVHQIDKIINDRAQAGNPFNDEELRQLDIRRERQLKSHADALKWVGAVRKQQASYQGPQEN